MEDHANVKPTLSGTEETYDASHLMGGIMAHLKKEKLRTEIRLLEMKLECLEKQYPTKPNKNRFTIVRGEDGSVLQLIVYDEEGSAALDFLPGEKEVLVSLLKNKQPEIKNVQTD